MATIDDVTGAIEALKGAIETAISQLGAAHGQADELYSQFQGMGAEGLANIANSGKDELEKIRSVLEQAKNESDTARATFESARG